MSCNAPTQAPSLQLLYILTSSFQPHQNIHINPTYHAIQASNPTFHEIYSNSSYQANNLLATMCLPKPLVLSQIMFAVSMTAGPLYQYQTFSNDLWPKTPPLLPPPWTFFPPVSYHNHAWSYLLFIYVKRKHLFTCSLKWHTFSWSVLPKPTLLSFSAPMSHNPTQNSRTSSGDGHKKSNKILSQFP